MSSLKIAAYKLFESANVDVSFGKDFFVDVDFKQKFGTFAKRFVAIHLLVFCATFIAVVSRFYGKGSIHCDGEAVIVGKGIEPGAALLELLRMAIVFMVAVAAVDMMYIAALGCGHKLGMIERCRNVQ